MFEHGVGIKNPLFFVGVVENNNDPRKEQRVQVRAFGIHGTNTEILTENLPWAICIKGDYDPNGKPGWGLPSVDSWVFGFFLDGRDAQQPMILGLIPTQNLTTQTPSERGWGRIPAGPYGERLALGNEPENYGQPANSRLARGEDIHETAVFSQEMGRISNIKVGGSETTWAEPVPAYNAEYPHNRVIQTSCHTIEIDDSPGAERIMIMHGSGSYVQIDNRGTTTHKSVSDKFEINDRKQHVYVGGMSTVTINGNSYVYVKGNKIEEIEGDLQTLVHGNHMLSVGGQSTINAGEQVQVRGADVKLEANVGTFSFKSGKEIQIQSGEGIYFKSEKVYIEGTDELHMKGNSTFLKGTSSIDIFGEAINMQSTGDFNLKSGLLYVGSNGLLHISGTTVNIDDNVSMANSEAVAPGSAFEAEGSIDAASVQAPEPVSKSTSINPPQDEGSMGSSGYSSKDHSGEGGGQGGGGTYNGTGAIPTTPISSATQNAITPLLDFIGSKEAPRGYDQVSGLISQSDYPYKPITQLTIGELLDWQESIDHLQLSEASGRYQIIEDTLRGYDNGQRGSPKSQPSYYTPLYQSAGLSLSDLFSPKNQDKMATALLRGAGLDRYLAGTMSVQAFANAVAGVWASMPIVDGKDAGQSVYEGDIAGNSAKNTSIQAYLLVLDQIKTRNDTVISQPQIGPQ